MFYKQNEPIQNSVTTSRKGIKLTQAELADTIGVTRQTIIAIEKGNYTPSVLLALKLAQALNKKVEELFWI
ncbi:MAG TPA: helix-turn-helix domain-containing protein [Candidatus Limnocylindrales bacterium]|nr:helix-turn-helix domain-containing protein [Candidatus Limnocylindrales bacterium]